MVCRSYFGYFYWLKYLKDVLSPIKKVNFRLMDNALPDNEMEKIKSIIKKSTGTIRGNGMV